MKDLLFPLAGLFTIACAMGVVFSRNAVYSAFSLILTLFGLAGLFILWGSSLLGVLQILIYAGAIVVLFVFVVMLIDVGKRRMSHQPRPFLAVAGGLGAWFLSLLLLRTLNHARIFSGKAPHEAATDMRAISKLLFTDYLWPFEVLSLFLLAMVVAIFVIAKPDPATPRQGGRE